MKSKWFLGFTLGLVVILSLTMALAGCKTTAAETTAAETTAAETTAAETTAAEATAGGTLSEGEKTVLKVMKDILIYLGASENDVNIISDVDTANMKLNEYYKSMGSHAYMSALWMFFSKVNKGMDAWVNKELGAFAADQGWDAMLENFAGPGQQVGPTYGGYTFELGRGEEYTGSITGFTLKSVYSGYIPVPEGPVLDPDKTYKIGFINYGFAHPWCVANAEDAIWQASLHPNIEFECLDGEFDETKMVSMVDSFVARSFDGIMVWPPTEEPLVASVTRAWDAGIPCVDMDRIVNYEKMYHVVGNNIENGLQTALATVWKTMGEGGNIALVRKEMGCSVDAGRAGAYTHVLGSFPGYEVVASYHTFSNTEKSYEAIMAACQADNIDIVVGCGDEEAKGAVDALIDADKMYSGKYGKVLINCDGTGRAALSLIEEGLIEVAPPYPPQTSALALRVLLTNMGITAGLITDMPDFPQTIIMPALTMVTKEREIIFGIETFIPEEMEPYAFGQE